MLTTRQWRLKDFLEKHFEPGRFFSIREICDSVKFTDGSNCYKYDDRPTSHDRCVALGNDVRSINWEQCEGWKLIIKDKQGGVKLAESTEEFEKWWKEQHDALENRYKLLSVMKTKAEKDGMMPIFNMKLNPVDPNKNLKPIDAYMKNCWAIVSHFNCKIWLVNCGSVRQSQHNPEEAIIVGGKYDNYHCPCEEYFKISNLEEIKNYNNYRVIDLTK